MRDGSPESENRRRKQEMYLGIPIGPSIPVGRNQRRRRGKDLFECIPDEETGKITYCRIDNSPEDEVA